MELLRLVLPTGKSIATHKVSAPLVVHCISGEIEFTAISATHELEQGDLLHLTAAEPHSVTALENAVVLLTIIFN